MPHHPRISACSKLACVALLAASACAAPRRAPQVSAVPKAGVVASPEKPAVAKAAPASSRSYDEVVFPKDPAVINVRTEFQAKGDGVTDDTLALQKAIDAGSGNPTRVVYLPNGRYRLTQSLVVKTVLGPWLYGQSRTGTVLKLDDGVSGVTAVLRTHPNETGDTSSDWFMRNIRNLTIDVGNNPKVDGIRYYATNSGILQNVTVRGNGNIGVNSSFLGQSGPNMLQDVLVEGFETGIVASWVYGQTLSRITVKNCRKLAVAVEANAVAIEDLTVLDTPVALKVSIPNDWENWAGVVALVGGHFSSSTPQGPAIVNAGVLYARDVRTQGYSVAVESSGEALDAKGPNLEEYMSEPLLQLFDNAPKASLRLPIKVEPSVPWESNLENWVSANDFGAIAGDEKDDSGAFQKSIDSAASSGKTTVYFRGGGGPDPNWYIFDKAVFVHGSVRHVIGLGFGRILANKPNAGFVVNDASAPVVKFQGIDAFGGDPITLENRAASRTLVVESCGVQILGTGTGDIFATDVPGLVLLKKKGQHMWARHLNVEGRSDDGLVQNLGADLWILGTKSEGKGLRYRTTSGGRTEIFGAFQYTNEPIAETDRRPMFDVNNAWLSVAGVREICHNGQPYVIKVREQRGEEVRELDKLRAPGWTSWPLYNGASAASN